MSLFHSVIYTPEINWVIRNVNYLLSPLLPSWIKIHPAGKLKVQVDHHDPFFLKTNQTSYLTRELFWNKSKNFEYSGIFIDLVKKVNTFFDVGANIGYYSILGCKVNPDLKVWAFEPSKGAMYYMGENVEINDLQERIIVEALALSDVCGEIDFYEMRNLKFPKIYNLSGEHNIGTKKEKISYKTTVESITLDDYVNRKSIPDIDLIKLDTEGAENLILRGAGKTLRSHEPVIICETLFNKIEKELESIMRNYDYEFYNHTHDGLKNVKSIVRAKDNGVRNCFFIPRSKVQLVEEWVV